MRVLCAIIYCILTGEVLADVYLHNPRGSNNRLDGNGRARNNANRLFDSQNNDRGGYNVGSLYYNVGSKLSIEWTNQHSCQDQNNHCEIILQYMCSPLVRDGNSESTIPEKPAECSKNDCNMDFEYGMHEDFYYYSHCRLRTRNKGLFTANQNLKGDSAKHTRQNPAGTRRGYECPEERDYYPYWGPTPWKDIAVMTNDVKRCVFYQKESQNMKPRFACEVPYQYLYTTVKEPKDFIPINKEKCEAFDTIVDGETVSGVWREYPAHGIPPPDCINTIWTRDNHLGNTFGGNPPMFNWTLPDDANERCVMRIRYNISTGEYDGWNTTSAQNNRVKKDGLGVDLWSRYNLNEVEAENREYYLKNNPELDVFGGKRFTLRLAVNTAQYGRTFQDRTHRFAIRSRPSDLEEGIIYNVNVRGKRGNIVQVYPAVEYDFVPNHALLSIGDYAHFQWTGSNDNPNNNAGQGRAGTDRSNVVMMRYRNFPEGDPSKQSMIFGHAGVNYPSNVSEGMAGIPMFERRLLAMPQFGGVMKELDDAGTYFDLKPQKITMSGDYNYMCTRNNNFSNRSQKGKLVVRKSSIAYGYVGELGGKLSVSSTEEHESTGVQVPPSGVHSPTSMQLVLYHDEEAPIERQPPNTDYVSKFVMFSPEIESAKPMTMVIALKSGEAIGTLYEPVVYRSRDTRSWVMISVDSDKTTSSSVEFLTDTGGHFVVSRKVAPGPMAGLVLGCLVAVLLIIALAFYCKTAKMPLKSYSSKV